MPMLQINYDLIKTKDYPSLHQAIKNLGDWCHPLDSCWLVQSSHGAIVARDYLRAFIDNDDRLLVTTVASGDEWAWSTLSPNVAAWIKRHYTAAIAA